MEKTKEERIAYTRNRNITLQPYVIVVGATERSLESYYLCIDEIIYEIPTLLEALDTCFKSFHVFNAKYPLQSEQIRLALQVGLYKFRTKWDSKITSTIELVNDMSCDMPLMT